MKKVFYFFVGFMVLGMSVSFLQENETTPKSIHEQFLLSRPVSFGRDVKVGDFVFLSKPSESVRMKQMMVYLGDDQLVDSDGTVFEAQDLLGQSLGELCCNQECKDQKSVFFGSFSES